MRSVGIIAEYNPFHTGHRYHIQKTKEAGATHVAVVMSTSFVQRGEPAAFDSNCVYRLHCKTVRILWWLYRWYMQCRVRAYSAAPV